MSGGTSMPQQPRKILAFLRELLGIRNARQRAAAAHAEVFAVHWTKHHTETRKHGNTEGFLVTKRSYSVFRDSVCCYFTSSSSTSNTSVAFGGITPPAPRAP